MRALTMKKQSVTNVGARLRPTAAPHRNLLRITQNLSRLNLHRSFPTISMPNTSKPSAQLLTSPQLLTSSHRSARFTSQFGKKDFKTLIKPQRINLGQNINPAQQQNSSTRLQLIRNFAAKRSFSVKHRRTQQKKEERKEKEPPICAGRPDQYPLLAMSKIRNSQVIEDDFTWLRCSEVSQEDAIFSYLEAENSFTLYTIGRSFPEKYQKFKKELETFSFNPPETVPEKIGDFTYFTTQTKDYKSGETMINLVRDNPDGRRETFFTYNSKTDVQSLKLSPDHRFVAYSLVMDDEYVWGLYIKDTKKGVNLESEMISDVGTFEWANNDTLIYTVVSHAGLPRPSSVKIHKLGTNVNDDIEIFHENDQDFSVEIFKSKDGQFVFLGVNSLESNEVWQIDTSKLNNPKPKLIEKRKPGVKYSVEHANKKFVVTTNENAPNNKVLQMGRTGSGKKTEIVSETQDTITQVIVANTSDLVVQKNRTGLPLIQVISTKEKGPKLHNLQIPEPVCDLYPGLNHNYKSPVWRFDYSSPFTKSASIDVDLRTHELATVSKTQSPLDPTHFVCRRFEVGPHGIPLTLIYHKDIDPAALPEDERPPTLLRSFGSFGHNVDIGYSAETALLLQRKWLVALIHPRGGGEKGTKWHEMGKGTNKINTFHDIVTCTEWLVKNKYTTPSRIGALGEHVGALAFAAAANLRPELFTALALDQPFVDVTFNMTDPSIVLPHEYEEFGDPKVTDQLDQIIKWDPYLNLPDLQTSPQYPHVLVTSSITDPRIPYWIPVRYIAQFRAQRPHSYQSLMRIDDPQEFNTPPTEKSALQLAWLAWLLEKKDTMK